MTSMPRAGHPSAPSATCNSRPVRCRVLIAGILSTHCLPSRSCSIHWHRGVKGWLAVLPEIDRVPFSSFLDCTRAGFSAFRFPFFFRVFPEQHGAPSTLSIAKYAQCCTGTLSQEGMVRPAPRCDRMSLAGPITSFSLSQPHFFFPLFLSKAGK
ncbi:hypothetical protein HDK77DRAFT_79509 [Phyllosticta capitalensis]